MGNISAMVYETFSYDSSPFDVVLNCALPQTTLRILRNRIDPALEGLRLAWLFYAVLVAWASGGLHGSGQDP